MPLAIWQLTAASSSTSLTNSRHKSTGWGDDVDRVESGVAVALSSVGPDLTGAGHLVSPSMGFFQKESGAVGGGATTVVWRNAAQVGTTGGIGVGLDDDDAVGGHVGGQFTW